MKRIVQVLLLYILFLSSAMSIGQTDTLATTSYDEIWEQVVEEFNTQKDTLRATALSKYVLDRAKVENNQEQIGRGFENYAFGIGVQGKLKKAIATIDSAIHTYETYGLKKNAQKAYLTKAAIYNLNFKITESIAPYYKALELAYENEDYTAAYAITNGIGQIKGSLEDYKGAVQILRSGLESVSNEDFKFENKNYTRRELKTSFHLNIANAYRNAEQIDSSLFYLDRAEEIMILPNDSCQTNRAYEIRANALIKKNEFKRAADYLEKSTKYCRPMIPLDSLRWCNSKGEILLGLKRYRQSVEVLKKGLSIYKVTPAEEKFMVDYYKTMAKAYKNLGIIDSANFFLEKHLNTTSQYSELRSGLSNSFRKQEVKGFQKELDTLAEQKSYRDSLILYGSISGGLIIIVLALGLVKSHKKRKENEHKFETLLSKVSAAQKSTDIIDTKDTILEEQSSSDVNPETTNQILEGLKKLEEQHYFLHPACSAHNVAKRIKTNTTYLSKVINAAFGKNFSTYVNDLRINYAIVKLKEDPQFRKYTISSIATELGYKSADSFTKYFKKDTGLLPSFYIKKLNETA